MRDPVEYGHGLLSVSSNSADEQNPGGLASSGPYQSPVNGVIIKNNTFYTPFNQTSANLRCPFWLAKVNATVTDLQIFNGTRVWSSNVWASLSQGSFYKQNASPGEGDWVSYFPGVSDSSGTATWGKERRIGGRSGRVPCGRVSSGNGMDGMP